SAAALDLREPDHEAPRLLCGEVYKGAPLSFLTEDAATTMRELKGVATVVPTTTRTPAQLARVHLPGPPARYAIASNGGPLLAAGDSLLDADLLDAADAAIRPAHGELAATGFTRPHVAVTPSTGVAAGAELLKWIHDRALSAWMSVSGTL